MARKYFGTKAVIGKTLKMNNDSMLTVTGILAGIPDNSHLQFDFILPMAVNAQVDEELRKMSGTTTTSIAMSGWTIISTLPRPT